MRGGKLLSAVVLAMAVLAVPAQAVEGEFVPLDRPGPGLGVPQAQLDASLRCSEGLDGATRTPVLLNPATGVTAEQNYAWNYERQFRKLGIPYCAYTAPDSTLGDIQVSGEYLVHAIRTMHARAGRRISILGHSQGGMSMRWALRFWPDTRGMVDDVIGMAPSNHGSTQANGDGRKPPASWQQAATSRFIEALNSRAETFAGISYTNVFTNLDEVVTPPPSSGLTTGEGRITNVAVQSVCPADLAEHLTVGTTDPVAYALVMDALDRDGPADPARVDRAVCLQPLQPGVDPLNVQNYLQVLAGAPGLLSVFSPVPVGDFPTTTGEPGLQCYVFVACAGSGPDNLVGRDPTARRAAGCTSRRVFTIRLPRGLRRARVTVGGDRVRVRRRGSRPQVRVDLRGRPRTRVLVRISGRTVKGRTYRDTRVYRTCRRG